MPFCKTIITKTAKKWCNFVRLKSYQNFDLNGTSHFEMGYPILCPIMGWDGMGQDFGKYAEH